VNECVCVGGERGVVLEGLQLRAPDFLRCCPLVYAWCIVFVFVEEAVLKPDKISNLLKHCVIHLNIHFLFPRKLLFHYKDQTFSSV